MSFSLTSSLDLDECPPSPSDHVRFCRVSLQPVGKKSTQVCVRILKLLFITVE